MKTFYGILATIAVAAFFVYLVRLRLQMRQDSQRKQARKAFRERESERDRRACLAAAKALDSGSAPREGFDLASASVPSRKSRALGGESLDEGIQRRQRAATSTAFDPDLPAR